MNQASELLATAGSMLQELQRSPAYVPSAYWADLNVKNARMLEAEGLENFKRTLSQNYYTWLITQPRHAMFRHAFLQWLRNPNLLPFNTRLDELTHLRLTTTHDAVSLSSFERHVYRLYVCFVWSTMLAHDRLKLHERLSEPLVGNPISVRSGNKVLTQDLANSILECNVIADVTSKCTRPRVAELGAGYGRLAQVFSATQRGQYFIFDVPPALAVSQWYLQSVIGPEKVFAFRPFERLEEVAAEMERASVVFLTANQMEKFPDGFFDAIVSISTLPELSPEQVSLYLTLFQRKSGSHIFLKQWKRWKNPLDGTDLNASSYQLNDDWRICMDRTDAINSLFFNRVWERTGSKVM